MSKKSSYMDTKNIISESFIDKLVRSLIPKSVQQKITSAYLKKNKEELYKLNTVWIRMKYLMFYWIGRVHITLSQVKCSQGRQAIKIFRSYI